MSSASLNPNSLESAVSSFFSFPDSPSLSISSSFDRVLHNLLSSADDSLQDQLIDRGIKRFSLLLESTKQCFRKRATLHNSIFWLLPLDLTLKVFSMLDTKSLVRISACCTMFNKYAMDPSCYTDIDLTTAFKHVDDRAVFTMINRAGKKLRSFKLGCVTDDKSFTPLLQSYCLAPLTQKQYARNLLSLHIYNLRVRVLHSLRMALSACSNLTDLKIIGLDQPLDRLLCLLRKNCRLIEHLFLNNHFKGIINYSTIEAFVINCPNITSLTLINFNLNDAMAQTILKGFRKLKYMDLSSTSKIHGSFLRDLGHSCDDSPLETLILRNCYSLEKREVSVFLNSLIKGDFKFMRYIEISSKQGLASIGARISEPRLPLEMLKENRPEVTFVADFPSYLPDYCLDIGFPFSEGEDEDEEEEVVFHLEDSESDEDLH